MRLALIEAWDAYHPPQFDGSIVLIRSDDKASNPEKNWQVESLTEVTGADVTAHVVPGGDHFELLREPHVRQVAEIIKALD